MKLKNKLFASAMLIVSVFLIVLLMRNQLSQFDGHVYNEYTRHITVRIISKSSKSPMSGIKIDYVLYAAGYNSFMGLVIPETRTDRVVYTKTIETNEDGVVNILVPQLDLGSNETIDGEEILVNIKSGFMRSSEDSKIYPATSSINSPAGCSSFLALCVDQLPSYDNKYPRYYILNKKYPDSNFKCGPPASIITKSLCRGSALKESADYIRIEMDLLTKEVE